MHSPCTYVQSELRLDRIGHVLSRPILPSPLTRFLILALRTIFSLTCFPHMLFNQADRWSPVSTPPSTTIYEWAIKKKNSISAPHNSAVDAQYALTDSQLAGLVDPVVLLVDPVVLLPILNLVYYATY